MKEEESEAKEDTVYSEDLLACIYLRWNSKFK